MEYTDQQLKEGFQKMLDYAGIKNFSAEEVLFLGNSNSNPNSPAYQKNELPPINKWFDIIPTLEVLENLRERFANAPIIITCGYRNEEYNRLIGGAPGSQHKEFTGVDFQIIDPDTGPGEWAKELMAMRDEKLFVGGIGIYNTFVHIDTRGKEATWDNRT